MKTMSKAGVTGIARRLVLLLLLVVGAGLAACEGANQRSESSTEEELEPLTFRLKWLIYSSFGSHFVAQELGYFEEEGLDVAIEPGGPGVDPIRLVATGADDVGLAGHEQILMARERGLPVVAIGEDYIRSGVGFFSLQGSGITEPEDFVGQKVGILPGTDKYTIYNALMAEQGIDRSQIDEIPVGLDLQVLFNGSVDVYPGFITNQPFIAAERGMPVNVIDPYEYGVRPGGNVYFTSERALREKRDQLKGFLRAAMRGILISQEMADSSVINIVLQYNDELDPAAELKIWRSTKDILLESDPAEVGIMSDEAWQYTADIALRYDLLDQEPDLESAYTNELVEEIHREGFTAPPIPDSQAQAGSASRQGG